MRLPALPYIRNNSIKRITIEWTSINKTSAIRDNEFSSAKNLSTKEFPFISPRPSREAAYTLTAGKALFAGPKLAWVDDTTFKYDNATEGTVSASAKYMVDFNGRIIIFPDKKAYDYVADTFAPFGFGTYPAPGSVPDIDYACTLNNRIWACKDDNVYATALGEYDDWTTFSSPSEATDAYQVDTGTNGKFTGITSYNGAVYVFKTDRVFKLFGTIPADFQLVEISRLGCVNHKSICEVNGILFWLSPQGVCAYTGGVPEVIGENLGEGYTSGVAGGDGRRYYISLYDGSSYTLYVYDTWKGVWLPEDDLQVIDFALLDGVLYALASDNKIYKFNSGTEKVEWEAVTKEYTEQIGEKKGYSELVFMVDLESGSTLQVFIRINNGSYELVKAYSSNDLQSFRVVLPVRRANHFAVKLVGKGEGKIYQFERRFHIGSNI